ncbi:uncharacterized protein LOC108453746 isoform X2 [Gossypium arboreum]|uniref:uncharacterized protein LOC108453746 isoform X2 n=1 Tax=Gossypium arboreum TaxID=29729 RepID=UPI0022F176A2|nr:uncharacterized protein LOC108453746 isoform X2 [Gossypium arboreum]
MVSKEETTWTWISNGEMVKLWDPQMSACLQISRDQLSARIHDNCTIWEHDGAWNHVGILGFLLQNFFNEEDATKLSVVHGGDVCTLHGLNSCQCIFRRSYPILIFKCGDFVVGGKSMPIFEH